MQTVSDPAAYGDGCAEFYDELYASVEPGLLNCLQQLAGDGPVLELGLGSGRIAIPLANRGLEVHAVEASSKMLTRFRSKPDAHKVSVIQGDFATLELPVQYRLIVSLVSTFDLLCSSQRQQSALDRIAAHLKPDGLFVNEAFECDQVGTVLTQVHELMLSSGPQRYRVTSRSIALPIFDEMAQAAGLQVSARWCNWHRHPYVPNGLRHVTVYARASERARGRSASQPVVREKAE